MSEKYNPASDYEYLKAIYGEDYANQYVKLKQACEMSKPKKVKRTDFVDKKAMTSTETTRNDNFKDGTSIELVDVYDEEEGESCIFNEYNKKGDVINSKDFVDADEANDYYDDILNHKKDKKQAAIQITEELFNSPGEAEMGLKNYKSGPEGIQDQETYDIITDLQTGKFKLKKTTQPQ